MTKDYGQHIAAGLWIVAAMLATFATLEQDGFLAVWAILAGQVANAFTFYVMLANSRCKVMSAIESEEGKIDRFTGAVLGVLGDDDRPRPLRR